MNYIPPCAPLQSYLIFKPSYVTPALFCLVVVCVIIDLRPSKATESCILFIFVSFQSLPDTMRQRPPTRSYPHAPPLQHPSHRGRQLLVDCCVSLSNGSHLRPNPHLSLYFLMVFRGVIGWGRRYPAHGDRGQSRWRVCRVAAAHFGCCVLCVVFVTIAI